MTFQQIVGSILILAATANTYIFNESQASRSRCWTSGNGQSAKWWSDGERVDRGKFWYTCRKGQLEPVGCFAENKQRIEVGQEYENDGYVFGCVLGSNGYLQFKYTGCLAQDGSRKKPGEKWTDDKHTYFYQCKQDGAYLKVTVESCLSHDKTKKIAIGHAYDYGDYTYECSQKSNGSVQMCSVGCVYEGQRYKVGEQWNEGDYVFYCKLSGGRCQKMCIGCQYQNKKLYDGDRYTREQTVYQCEIRPDAYGHKAVGCVSQDNSGLAVERVVGCRWYIQSQNSKIEQTCTLEGTKTKINTIGCIYRYRGYDTIFLNPDSYTVWNMPKEDRPIGLVCKTQGQSALLETFDPAHLQKHTRGMKYEQPRGK